METTTRFNCHLTENHQLQAADALISKLKQELGAANAYIEELEEEREPIYRALKKENKELLKQIDEMQQKVDQADEKVQRCQIIVNKVTARYSVDLTALKQEPVIQTLTEKYETEIKDLQTDLDRALRQRDEALAQLVKLNAKN